LLPPTWEQTLESAVPEPAVGAPTSEDRAARVRAGVGNQAIVRRRAVLQQGAKGAEEDPEVAAGEERTSADVTVANESTATSSTATAVPAGRQTQVPILGPDQYLTFDDKGSRFYLFRLEDAIMLGPRLKRATLLRYFADNFDLSSVKDREAFVDEFAGREGVAYVPQGGATAPPATKPGASKEQLLHAVEVPAELHARALLWIRLRHPEIAPRHLEEKVGIKARTGEEKAGRGGFQERRFEPRGEIRLNPRPVRSEDEIPTYVAYGDLTSTSTVTASVHFEESDPDRNMLNFFPNHADFDWKLTRGGKVVDTGPIIKYGEISRKLKLPDPGLYTLTVTVKSPYFTSGRRLELETYLWALKEAQRAADVFEQYLVGDDPEQPFVRAPDGTLKIKEGRPVKTIEDEILELNAMIGAIKRLEKDGKLDSDDAEVQLKYLGEKLTSLEKVQGVVGTDQAGAYLVQGTFVSREDSSVTPISAVMQRTARQKTGTTLKYEITLYDFTLSTTDPVRHVGESTTELGAKDAVQAEAGLEKSALQQMADHWHAHNDYSYGTVKLAVGLLETPGVVHTISIDTYNVLRTGAKVGAGVAAVGGVVLLGLAPFTGGATAPVGVLILEGVTIVAGAATAIYNINERIQKDTFHADAQLVLDLMAFVPVLGSISKALRASRALLNGMLFVGLATTGIAMTIATRNELIAVEARYNAGREPLETRLGQAQTKGAFAEVAQLETQLAQLAHDRDGQVAQIIGAAAVSGGLLLIQFGVSAAQAARPGPLAAVEPRVGEPKVGEPKIEAKVVEPKVGEPKIEAKVVETKPTAPPVETKPTETAAETKPAETKPAETKPASPEQAKVEQRRAEVKAIEDEIADIGKRRAAAEAKRLAEKDALTKKAIAKRAEAEALDRQAKATRDPNRRAELQQQAENARAEWEAAREEQIANQDEVEGHNRDRRDAEKRLDETRENLKLAEAGRRLADTKAVTDRLAQHVKDAVAKVDAGIVQPEPGDAKAAAAGQMPPEVARGNAIDKAAKAAMLADPELEGLKVTPRGGKGPDIYDPLTKRWWDMTTPEEWADHVKRYSDEYGKGTPLFTRPAK